LQDLTARARDSLVSFGERMSTRIFASYLRQRGVPARQLDAPEIGFITSDDFGNADIIYEQTLPKVCRVCGGCVWGGGDACVLVCVFGGGGGLERLLDRRKSAQ
jgi:aspartate kinase